MEPRSESSAEDTCLRKIAVLACALCVLALAAQKKAITKVDFFQLLKQHQGKPETVLKAVKDRGCDFRLTATEESQALGAGADFGLLIQLKLNHRDNVAGREAQKKSQPPKSTAAKTVPRTPRTP